MTIKNVIYILFVSLILIDIAYSQIYYNSAELPESAASDSITFKINRVEIIGNNKTKDFVILRELHFNANDVVNLKEIFLAQKRILSLFLFYRVIFDLVGDEESIILLITVAERWYIFPLPILYLNERSWNKISYGATFNFGLGQYLSYYRADARGPLP